MNGAGSLARVTAISGPVLHARTEGPFLLREAIKVGTAGLLGEVIRVQGDEIVAQVYEDTTGLRPGVVVTGTGDLLGIRVGPALLGRIFDGLLRPLPGEREPLPGHANREAERLDRRRARHLRVHVARAAHRRDGRLGHGGFAVSLELSPR